MVSLSYLCNVNWKITDKYLAVGQLGKTKYLLSVKVRYSGDKDEVTFEQLEGRR